MNDAGNTEGISVATTLYKKAAPVPRPISVHMLGLRCSTDCAPRAKNGQPAHMTTGRDRTSSIPLCVAISNQPRRWPNMASTVTTTVSGKVHQKRCWNDTSSEFSSSSSVGSKGSSVMPHFGQSPGRAWRISGCIGQV